ncbi:MAG: hypothetical protein ACJA1B_002653, partial [Polaribacter sp.]
LIFKELITANVSAKRSAVVRKLFVSVCARS